MSGIAGGSGVPALPTGTSAWAVTSSASQVLTVLVPLGRGQPPLNADSVGPEDAPVDQHREVSWQAPYFLLAIGRLRNHHDVRGHAKIRAWQFAHRSRNPNVKSANCNWATSAHAAPCARTDSIRSSSIPNEPYTRSLLNGRGRSGVTGMLSTAC
jgi:hypothetical protein